MRLFLAILALGAPLAAAAQPLPDLQRRDPGGEPVNEDEPPVGSEGLDSFQPVTVPEAMLPAAGECRLWIRGLPATHQPDPIDCMRLNGDAIDDVYLVVEGRAWYLDHDWTAVERADPGTVPPIVLELGGEVPPGRGAAGLDVEREAGTERDPGAPVTLEVPPQRAEIAHQGRARVAIPGEVWPEARMCRIYYPDREPELQPEAERCEALDPVADTEAFLLTGREAWYLGADWAGREAADPGSVPDVVLKVAGQD